MMSQSPSYHGYRFPLDIISYAVRLYHRFGLSCRTKPKASKDATAHLGFEAKLWLTADKLRNNMDAAEYEHVVLGLIFLKYISDTFEEHHVKLVAGEGDLAGANPEGKDESLAGNVFWVPKEGRWAHLQSRAKLPRAGCFLHSGRCWAARAG